MAVEQILNAATEHHMAGRIDEAEAMYRQVLTAEPENVDALHRLGVVAMQRGDHAKAVELIGRAVALRPAVAHIQASLGQALAAAGRNSDAVTAFERALLIKGDLTEAIFGLAGALMLTGKTEQAMDAYRRLLAIRPDAFDARMKLGNALFGVGRVAEAADQYHRAVQLRGDSADAVSNLASALKALGKLDQAIEIYQQALKLAPNSAMVYCNLGGVLSARKRFDEAEAALRRAIELQPDLAAAAYNLGNVLAARGESLQAAEQFRRAIALEPNYVDAHNNLGNMLQGTGDYRGATEAYLAALRIRPDFVVAYNNLGSALRTMGKTDDAIAAFQQTLQLRPTYHHAWCNLGNTMKDAGRIDEANQCYRRAIELQPRDAISHSNLVFSMMYDPKADPESILAEALRWDAVHAAPLKGEIPTHDNYRSADRRLKIGYLGADFRAHCQSLFTIPLFSNHDRENFEIFCYSQQSRSDVVTERIRGLVEQYRSIIGLSDTDTAQQIRDDGIDILVDLTMHMSNGRPLVLARKPAPIQVAWLAYPGTTGLATMDYRLTDVHLDPPGNDRFYSEKSIRLPDTFWCYDPLCDCVDPGPLPALSNGFITLGCLNNFCKTNDGMVATWVQVMQQLPGSRLLLLASEGSHRQKTLDRLKEGGIDSSRIEFFGHQPRWDYLRLYQRIDFGLDSFPYNGHTTSLDSFWMGAPVVTLVGESAVARAGWCQLSNLGLTELAARSREEFASIAVALAKNLPRLAELRSTLRARMKRSPLMDGLKFARNVEASYRHMWKTWVESPCAVAQS